VTPTTVKEPLVSLVIPVYNAMPYLVETLDAIPAQGLDQSDFEVVLVNDGSDDGSERVLAEYAQKYPNFRVLNQPNSGGPADPCNKGVAAARGKYFFVLGSDDVLTDGALGDLVAYAESEGSDIVLAKMAGLNGAHAPGTMFKRSVADAHLVEDKLYNTLTAIKLFRTELVSKGAAHHPTHLRVGSDQPFTLACYLAADKISVRADRDYVLIRRREDGTNVTSSRRSSMDFAQLVTATVAVIVDGTPPGPLRDGLLRRPVQGAMLSALQKRFLDLDGQQQDAVIAELREAVGPYFTDPLAAHLAALPRLKARLALAGRTDVLRRLIVWESNGGTEMITRDEAGFLLDLPSELAEQIGEKLLRDVPPRGVAVLEGIAVDCGQVRLMASARIRRGAVPPDNVTLRVRNRRSDDWFDVPARSVEVEGRAGEPAAVFRAEVDYTLLRQGVWDLYVVHRYGGEELVNRLGRHRAEGITADRRPLLNKEGAAETGVAYFTQSHGNLSFDIGFTLQSRTTPDAQVLTVLQTHRGECIVLLQTGTWRSSRFTVTVERKEGEPGKASVAQEVPVVPVGEDLVALQLPRLRKLEREERGLRVTDVVGSVVLSLPAAVEMSETRWPKTSILAAARTGGARIRRKFARRLGIQRPSVRGRDARAQR